MKFSINKSNTLRWMLLGIFPLMAVSCKKEEIRSRELKVFLQPDIEGIATQTQSLSFTHTPADVRGERDTEVYAYLSREINHDVTVYLAAAPDRLASYNATYSLETELMPAGSYQITSGDKYTIPAGQRQSNPIRISITTPQVLTNPDGYVLPLAITKVESKDKGAIVSTSHDVIYLRVHYNYTNVETTQAVPTGTLMDRAGWSVTVSNTTSGAPATNLVDGNNSTVWRSSNSASAAKWIQVDMGSAQTIKGFRLSPNYTNTNENATGLTILSSNDNTNWTTQGKWTGTGPASGTNATNPDFKGVQFIEPVTARYYRIEYTSWVSGNRVGLAELNAIQ